MIILVDSREQLKLEFSHPYITEVRVTKLEVGDYSVVFADGYQPPYYLERKNLADLFGTLTSGHDRFRREIERAKANGYKLEILIEGSLTKLLNGTKFSTVQGITILRQLFTIYFKYGVPFHCFRNREEMALWIIEAFVSLGRQYMNDKNSAYKER